MPDPIATTTLSGDPATGVLALPAPRPAYEIEITRTSPTTATLRARGTFPGEIAMHFHARSLDADLNRVPALWQGFGSIDGYAWRITTDEHMRELRVFDQPQPYRGPLAELTADGRVVARDEPVKRKIRRKT